jgi:hypothetical protein
MRSVTLTRAHSIAQIENIVAAELEKLVDDFIRSRYYVAALSDVVVSANLLYCGESDTLEVMLTMNTERHARAIYTYDMYDLHNLLRERLAFTDTARRAQKAGYDDVAKYVELALMSIHVSDIIGIDPRAEEEARTIIVAFLRGGIKTASSVLTRRILEAFAFMQEAKLRYV